MTDAQLRAELIRKGLIKPTEHEVFHVKQHVRRLVDDRPVKKIRGVKHEKQHSNYFDPA